MLEKASRSPTPIVSTNSEKQVGEHFKGQLFKNFYHDSGKLKISVLGKQHVMHSNFQPQFRVITDNIKSY